MQRTERVLSFIYSHNMFHLYTEIKESTTCLIFHTILWYMYGKLLLMLFPVKRWKYWVLIKSTDLSKAPKQQAKTETYFLQL